MGIDFYMASFSPPCRSVMMTARSLGVELDNKLLNVLGGEQLQPQFVELNPQHTIPTINDNGFILWESRAIQQYLVETYGKDSNLYPAHPQQRALVNQRLYFDIGTLYLRMMAILRPIIREGATSIDPVQVKKLEEALGWLEKFLTTNVYVAGTHMTIADHSIAATVSTLQATGFNLAGWSHVKSWLSRCEQEVPGYDDINTTGCQKINTLIKGKMEQHGFNWP